MTMGQICDGLSSGAKTRTTRHVHHPTHRLPDTRGLRLHARWNSSKIRLKQPGKYPFVTHAFADATKGAVGILAAEK